MFSGTVFAENCRKFQKYLWREVSAVFEDDYRYEDEEYHADDFEYIDDDEEENENALWDDEDAADA